MAHVTKRRTPRPPPSPKPRLPGTSEEHDRPRSETKAFRSSDTATQAFIAHREQIEDTVIQGNQRIEVETRDSFEAAAGSGEMHKDYRSRKQTVDVGD